MYYEFSFKSESNSQPYEPLNDGFDEQFSDSNDNLKQ